jgi:hypothetical protein
MAAVDVGEEVSLFSGSTASEGGFAVDMVLVLALNSQLCDY